MKIAENAADEGGGIYIIESNVVFDSQNRCNIYVNHAIVGNDLFSHRN